MSKNKPVGKNAVGYGFLASLQSTFRLTVCAYLNTQNTDCCRSLLKSYYSYLFFYKDPQVGLCKKAKIPENKTAKFLRQKIVTLNYLENSRCTRSYIDPNKYYLVLSCHTDYFLGHHASTGGRISHHALS